MNQLLRCILSVMIVTMLAVTLAEFATFVRENSARDAKIIKDAGIKAE